jgi:hypothetical protein
MRTIALVAVLMVAALGWPAANAQQCGPQCQRCQQDHCVAGGNSCLAGACQMAGGFTSGANCVGTSAANYQSAISQCNNAKVSCWTNCEGQYGAK